MIPSCLVLQLYVSMNFGSNWTLLQSDVNPRFFWWVLSLCHRLTPCKRNWDTCACFNVVMINCYLRYSIMCCTIFFIIWILIGWPVLCMLDGMYSLLPRTGQQQERLLALHAFLTRAVLMGLTLQFFFKCLCMCILYLCRNCFCGFYLRKDLHIYMVYEKSF